MIEEVNKIQSQSAKDAMKKAKTEQPKATPQEVPAEKKPAEAPPVVLKVE